MIHKDKQGEYIENPFYEGSDDVVRVEVDYERPIVDLYRAVADELNVTDFRAGPERDEDVLRFPDKLKGISKIVLPLARVFAPEDLSYPHISRTVEQAGLLLPDLRSSLTFMLSHPELFRAGQFGHRSEVLLAADGKGELRHTKAVMGWERSFGGRFDLRDRYDYSRLRWPLGAIVVCETVEDYGPTGISEKGLPESQTAQMLLDAALTLQDGHDPTAIALALDSITGLTLHPDSVIAYQAIDCNARLGRIGNDNDVENSYYEIGCAIGHSDIEVARFAVDTIIPTTITFNEDRAPNESFIVPLGLYWHAQKITEATAQPLFMTALDWINSRSQSRFSGDLGNQLREQGYELMGYLTRSEDVAVSRDATMYLVACTYGAAAAEALPEGLVTWLENRVMLANDDEDLNFWASSKTIMEGKRFSYRTQEAHKVLKDKNIFIPHAELRELAVKAIHDYEQASKATGAYFHFS